MGLGGAVGFGAGIGICLTKDLFSEANEDYKAVKLNIGNKIQSYRNECTVKQYKLFRNFLDNYKQFIDTESEKFRALECALLVEIPEFPVFSPHDVNRTQVYEKELIEEQLDYIDAKIALAKENGASEDALNELRATISPVRGEPFKKHELVMDVNYLEKVIVLISENLVLLEIEAGSDPMIKKGLECLLDHYKNHYNTCTKVIVDKLFKDCYGLVVPFTMCQDICNDFKENFDKKKNI